ncbi:hypothetical protein GM418_26815 [Maribellus comscasis]|uniref:Non-reducing end beta-L-arabinofuranosidase-like GH127 middle domain-containing protein n=1 Tax=Maribellus comscasis TaxID=2681766 RepID=A0A6I6KAE1_9BACT|nr:beta-L-arabinofuranosidase domain-containing protein [Maribellus comscasis]QGY47144.1 hypothetical protein GM418_26815 [Maribellus comscasis]
MNRFLYFSVIFFLLSCGRENRFPEPVSEKVSLDQVKIPGQLGLSNRDSNLTFEENVGSGGYLRELNRFQEMYLSKDSNFNLKNFEKAWNEVAANMSHSRLNLNDAVLWFRITGTLMQITGKAKYAEEMENIVLNGFKTNTEDESKEIENLVASYIFTKNVDHVHINLFVPAELQYEHTLHGKVKIKQETNFPDSGDISVSFSMEKNRYIEVFVRIPSWADGATVTVEGVKYTAPVGDYAFIAKKWHEGDEIKIHFPNKNQNLAGL